MNRRINRRCIRKITEAIKKMPLYHSKRCIALFVGVCLLLSSVLVAYADNLDLSALNQRATFSYNDDNNSSWSYYQFLGKTLDDGACVGIIAGLYGNNTEITSYPIFVTVLSDSNGAEMITQKGAIIIDFKDFFEVRIYSKISA